MPIICKVKERTGDFRLIRRGPKNSRVQLIVDSEMPPDSELVSTVLLEEVREDKDARRYGTTIFREWMKEMSSGWGSRPEWPALLCRLLDEQYLKERSIDRRYEGEFILRHREENEQNLIGEKKAVEKLFHACLRAHDGCLEIGDELFWLLAYEVPNQFKQQGQRADLLGLNQDGGLVVFEAKLANNSYAPVCALLEGLDYLAGLTCKSNFERLCEELVAITKARSCPKSFTGVTPKIDARHSVVVLAELDYFFGTFSRSPRGRGWDDLANLRPDDGSEIQFRFASTDFKSPIASWVYG